MDRETGNWASLVQSHQVLSLCHITSNSGPRLVNKEMHPFQLQSSVFHRYTLNVHFWQRVRQFFFNWRIIAFQYRVGFCHTATWVGRKYTYVPSLLNLPPTPKPHPLSLGCHRAPACAPCVILKLLTSYLFCTWSCIYFHTPLSMCPHSPLPTVFRQFCFCFFN